MHSEGSDQKPQSEETTQGIQGVAPNVSAGASSEQSQQALTAEQRREAVLAAQRRRAEIEAARRRQALKKSLNEELGALHARAIYSRTRNHLFYDSKAVELASRRGISLSDKGDAPALSRTEIAHIVIMDQLVNEFVHQNPYATVVNLGCGFDTRCYRTGTGTMRWYNLDVPPLIARRTRLMPETRRISSIARAVTDPTWPSEVVGSLMGTQLSLGSDGVSVAEPIGEVLIIIDNLVTRLTEEQAGRVFSVIDRGFEHATLLVTIASPLEQPRGRGEQGPAAAGKWGVASADELCNRLAWQFKPVREVSTVEGMREMGPMFKVAAMLPGVQRMAQKIAVIKK